DCSASSPKDSLSLALSNSLQVCNCVSGGLRVQQQRRNVDLRGHQTHSKSPYKMRASSMAGRQPQDIPDGHRAPPPLALRSIDTQTPGVNDRGSNNSSRAQSISPASFITISNEFCEESPCAVDDTHTDPRDKENGNHSPLPKYATSPKPNNSYMFKREPPEGCERVKVFEESSPIHPCISMCFDCATLQEVNLILTSNAHCGIKIPGPVLPESPVRLLMLRRLSEHFPSVRRRPGTGNTSSCPAFRAARPRYIDRREEE
ncbi:FAM117B, partial [Pelobates cultripes]